MLRKIPVYKNSRANSFHRRGNQEIGHTLRHLPSGGGKKTVANNSIKMAPAQRTPDERAINSFPRTRQRIGHFSATLLHKFNPPERRIERKLLRACRHNDAGAAASAWTEWRTIHRTGAPIDSEVGEAVTDLQRQLYGPVGHSPWDGSQLVAAFKKSHSAWQRQRPMGSKLPPLNPTSM